MEQKTDMEQIIKQYEETGGFTKEILEKLTDDELEVLEGYVSFDNVKVSFLFKKLLSDKKWFESLYELKKHYEKINSSEAISAFDEFDKEIESLKIKIEEDIEEILFYKKSKKF